MRLQDLWQGLWRMVQDGYQRFRVAMVLDAVLFLCIGAFTWRHMYDLYDWYTEELGCAAAAAAIGCIFAVALRLFLERRGAERRSVEVILNALVCGIFFVLVQGHDWSEPYILLKTVGPALAFASFGLYCLEGHKDGENPVLLVFFALSKAALVGTLLLVSLSICLTAFDSLLFSLDGTLHTTLYFLIAEFSYLFAGIHVLLASLPARGRDMEAPALFRALLLRVLLPVCLILLGILYLYVAKIVYVREIPVGTMNWFASLALLAFSVFFFCFAGDARQALLQRFLRWGLLLFLPILAVQAVAVWQRVEPYGLTVLRYTSILCTLFGVFLLALAFLRRSPRPAFLVLAAAVAVFTLTPLNIVDVPLRTQEARLWSVLAENDMLQDGKVVEKTALAASERERFLSAAEYLTEQEKRDFLETPGMRELLAKLRSRQKSEKHAEWFQFRAENPVYVPTAGWQEAYLFNDPSIHGVLVVDKGDGTKEQVDVSPYIAELLAYAHEHSQETGDDSFTREMRIEVDEHTCLWLHEVDLSVRGGKDGEEVTAHMAGVLLKR